MASTSIARASFRCSSCHHFLLNSLASLSGVSLQTSNVTSRRALQPPLNRLRPISKPLTRSFASTRDIDPVRKEEEQIEELEELASQQEDVAPEEKAPVAVPWYLQEQNVPATEEISPAIAERQRLPDLPEHPPPILQSLLSYLSVDLGLDYLNLMDLRHVDPPPALGANLLMVIGTARSEKHMNVCADRFCRWLRSNYKLRPHAAGLLGRNELKLKLRRKAKRSRLMANVGATDSSTYDDGISTGWICVTVGEVEPAPTQPAKVRRQNFIGFDDTTDSVNIVVQIFTEEKRDDTDLEGLWTAILKRLERERIREEQKQAELAPAA